MIGQLQKAGGKNHGYFLENKNSMQISIVRLREVLWSKRIFQTGDFPLGHDQFFKRNVTLLPYVGD